jgi:hypothetical protein
VGLRPVPRALGVAVQGRERKRGDEVSDTEFRAFVRGFALGTFVAWLLTNLVWQALK